jgi:hypothetical protein
MRRVAAFACAVMLMGLGVAPGHADKRVALVIGNGGMQFAGKNYLLPVDAKLAAADDVNRLRLAPLDEIMDTPQTARGARVIVLDACRNNPVEDDLKRRLASMPGANRDAFLRRGLGRIAAGNGLIVAYGGRVELTGKA